jgi:two-component system NarL family response regulator
MKKAIRILIVDDHFVVRMGLASSINMEADMSAIADASTGAQALKLYRKHTPDIVLMDLRLPDMTGIETTTAICKDFPEAKIIVISTYDGDEDIYRALQAGARSYLCKNVSREELLQTIRAVHTGQRYLPPPMAARLAERVHRPELSARELEVLQLIVKGMPNKEIAGHLSITEFTVKLHVGNILTKLNVADRTQASTTAIQRGIVHLE